MALYEQQKNAKVMEEIYGYLLEKGFKEITASINVLDTETVFKVTVEDKDPKFIKDFKDEMICCRDTDLEEYGWNIHSGMECTCTLNTLGMLIDTYEIDQKDNKVFITLHRRKV